MLSCPICHCNYTTTGENQPRLLTVCGHTFCYKCLEERKSGDSPETFQCPQCSLPCTEKHVPNITIMKYVDAMDEKPDERPVHQLPASQQEATCQACQVAKATLVCFQCLPTGFPFCDACSSHEHNRDFPPVQRHSPKLVGAVKVQTPVPTCATHTGKPCLFFSFKVNQFACENCRADRDFEQDEFQSIEDSVRRVREQVPNLTRLIRERVEVMQETRAELDTLLSRVDEEKLKTMDKVRYEFNQFDMALKRRLQDLLMNVESEANIQRKALQDQLDRLEVSQGDAETSVVQANMILLMQDYSYLHQAEQIISSMKGQLADEEDMLVYQRPVAMGNIPLHINPAFSEDISNLGVVGGGMQPTKLQVSVVKGLVHASWGKPDDPTVREYEIEYEQLDRESEIGTKSPIDPTPVSVKCKATALERTIDQLVPGKKYNFRIRSLNTAGWGRWSAGTTCHYPPFPLTVEHTGEIVVVVIPTDGLYCITAKGAKAADGDTKKGGRGAIIEAKFLLNKYDRLIILCGGMSSKVGPSTGGGGGTFVAVNKKRDLLIAVGGGGGTRGHDSEDYDGVDANPESGDGRDGVGVQWANGGANGECGKDAIFTGPCYGYGGAGFQSAAQSAKSFLHGGASTPGEGGGFGGGGAVGHYGGGGGGGYSGGGGGRGGGGGGSYVLEGGMDVKRWLGNEGHGSVTIVHVDSE